MSVTNRERSNAGPWGADYTPYLMLGVNASYPINEKMNR
jgi:hypothetical protein